MILCFERSHAGHTYEMSTLGNDGFGFNNMNMEAAQVLLLFDCSPIVSNILHMHTNYILSLPHLKSRVVSFLAITENRILICVSRRSIQVHKYKLCACYGSLSVANEKDFITHCSYFVSCLATDPAAMKFSSASCFNFSSRTASPISPAIQYRIERSREQWTTFQLFEYNSLLKQH